MTEYTYRFNEETKEFEVIECELVKVKRSPVSNVVTNLVDYMVSCNIELIRSEAERLTKLYRDSLEELSDDNEFILIKCRGCKKYFRLTKRKADLLNKRGAMIPNRCPKDQRFNQVFSRRLINNDRCR